jgi:hypothetical protein
MSELEDIKVTLRKLNHFSDEMLVWKGVVSTELKYMKWLLGGTFFVLTASFVKDLLGG